MKKIDIDAAVRKLDKKSHDYKTPIIELIEIQTKEPWKILVGTILSARTNDKTTTEATGRLFGRVKTLDGLADLSVGEIEKLIFPVGFYRNKAKFLKKLPGVMSDLYGGRIPETVDELVKLPGVGRKTANLVVTVAFRKDGICVDTHVHRIMNIWRYVETKNPLETEMALRKKLPRKYWQQINYLLVSHGQSICRPVSPCCDECVLNDDCPKFNVTKRKPKAAKARRSAGEAHHFVSWNVNGVRAAEKKGFIDIVKSSGADIYAIQETKASQDQLSDELLNIDGYSSYWHSADKKGYSGVAVYSRIEPIRIIQGLGKKKFDSEGRVLTLEFENFFFINGYYPNSQHELKRLDYKLAFNRAMASFCRKLRKTKSVVVCGDFNVAHKAIDLRNPKPNEMNPGYTVEERESMDGFVRGGFLDTFRIFNNDPDNYTWWSYRFNSRERNVGWRIDYFCIDEESKDRALGASISADVLGSDHCPVVLEYRKKR
jgi:exodeoxyribonuclease III